MFTIFVIGYFNKIEYLFLKMTFFIFFLKILKFFFFESGKGHAITTYNTEYSHTSTSVIHCERFKFSWSPQRRVSISVG
jgi:hypothetical protein